MAMTAYLVERHGSNAANQPVTPAMILGWIRAGDQDEADRLARERWTCYAGQTFSFKPASRCTNAERDEANEAERLLDPELRDRLALAVEQLCGRGDEEGGRAIADMIARFDKLAGEHAELLAACEAVIGDIEADECPLQFSVIPMSVEATCLVMDATRKAKGEMIPAARPKRRNGKRVCR